MKKSDLKTGMILEFANGERAMVYLGTETGDVVSGDTWFPLNKGVDEDLKAASDAYSDVVKVLHPVGNIGYKDGLRNVYHQVIWERPKEVTYKIGQCFISGVSECILVQAEARKVCMVIISGFDVGNRFRDPVEVKDPYKITEEELKQIAGNIFFFKLKQTEE